MQEVKVNLNSAKNILMKQKGCTKFQSMEQNNKGLNLLKNIILMLIIIISIMEIMRNTQDF